MNDQILDVNGYKFSVHHISEYSWMKDQKFYDVVCYPVSDRDIEFIKRWQMYITSRAASFIYSLEDDTSNEWDEFQDESKYRKTIVAVFAEGLIGDKKLHNIYPRSYDGKLVTFEVQKISND